MSLVGPRKFLIRMSPLRNQNITLTFAGGLDCRFFHSQVMLLDSILPLPGYKEELQQKHGSKVLPSHSWPTNHLLVGAEFSFSKQKWLDRYQIESDETHENMCSWGRYSFFAWMRDHDVWFVFRFYHFFTRLLYADDKTRFILSLATEAMLICVFCCSDSLDSISCC